MALTKEYMIALKSLKGIGVVTLMRIGSYIEENEIKNINSMVLAQILHDLKKEKVTIEQIDEALSVARHIIQIHEQHGIGITTYYDEDFPAMLRDTINEDGNNEPPMILYYKGDLNITNMPCLAVIGTREVTDFGKQAGLFLTKLFAKKGFCIVSGLAIGCDTIGHQGALAVGGKTIAFLANGLDSIYPPENESLAQEIIANGGLLMSEYPIGTGINRYNLVKRDRLQAGMSLGTLVIQTGEHGGTMHAANATLQANKPLYTVKFQYPEQNEHEKSLGNALLVKKGAKYISGNDYERALNYIENYQKPQTSLFD